MASPGAGFAINGQRPRGNNYMLDGTENNSAYFSGEDQIFAIVDAIEEVSVQTGNFGAEFGRAGGGIFNVVTKSGTNHLHGLCSGVTSRSDLIRFLTSTGLLAFRSPSSATIFTDSPWVALCGRTELSSLPVSRKQPTLYRELPVAGSHGGCGLAAALAISGESQARPLSERSRRFPRHGSAI